GPRPGRVTPGRRPAPATAARANAPGEAKWHLWYCKHPALSTPLACRALAGRVPCRLAERVGYRAVGHSLGECLADSRGGPRAGSPPGKNPPPPPPLHPPPPPPRGCPPPPFFRPPRPFVHYRKDSCRCFWPD